jgi:peptide/nickel transport system substrate-binding protein
MRMARSERRREYRCRLALLVLLVAVVAGGCGQAPAAPAPTLSAPAANDAPRRGGTLTMSLASDMQNWDPIVASDNPSIWTMLLVYDQLVRVAPDGRSVEPALAEHYAISADGKIYTFTMRQGVTFHDGTPLTVEDLQYAIERGTSQESSWRPLLPAIVRMATSDDRTLVVELAEPWAPFLADLALYAFSVIPKRQHQQRGAQFFDHPVGTGPFQFDRWERGSTVVLKRNPAFWDRRYPYLDAVEFQVLSDDNGRMLKFQGGELDIATNVPFNQIAALQQDPAVEMQVDPILGVSLIAINHTRSPFDDQNVRMAINMATDRAAIVKAVLFGHGAVANTVLPAMLYWSAGVPAYPYDVAKAKQLLSQSSQPNGFDTTLLIHAGSTLERATATIFQDQLKQIGVTLAIVEVDPASASERAMRGDYDMFYVSMTSDIIDPDELMAIPLAPSGGVNALFTNYKNDELDSLIRQAARTIDTSERARLYEQIQRMYREDAVVVPLFYPYSRTAVRARVKGFKVLPTANYRLWEVWLAR